MRNVWCHSVGIPNGVPDDRYITSHSIYRMRPFLGWLLFTLGLWQRRLKPSYCYYMFVYMSQFCLFWFRLILWIASALHHPSIQHPWIFVCELHMRVFIWYTLSISLLFVLTLQTHAWHTFQDNDKIFACYRMLSNRKLLHWKQALEIENYKQRKESLKSKNTTSTPRKKIKEWNK